LRCRAAAVTTHGRRCRAHGGESDLAQIRIAEKQKQLVERSKVAALVDALAGVMLTHLSG
jgi:hypothetical protein